MKLPLSWIKSYCDIDIEPDKYMNKMIMSGTAIEGWESAANFDGVVVGRILNIKPHENSDHLNICIVDIGKEENLQIVCGAPNVKEEILVPVATIGATLPGGYKIKKGKLRGVESHGMICSGPELDIPIYLYPSIGNDGILIFNEEYPLGMDVRKIFELDDIIFDFDILANRSDCLSVLGISRESAAVINSTFVLPVNSYTTNSIDINSLLNICVESEYDCPRYTAAFIDNVKITKSPLWLRSYLYKAGIRSINNIVDITNYIMLETGHPMHAFDFDKINGNRIIVRHAHEDEKLITLDYKEYSLTCKDLAICDSKGIIGLAGIMGGLTSEIDENTKRVVFECACFDRVAIRKSSRSLGIRTESSSRFEKGISVSSVPFALQRACYMVNKLQAGEVTKGIIDVSGLLPEQKIIETNTNEIIKITGVDIPNSEVFNILNRLGFEYELLENSILIKVPDFRLDIEGVADISEEILRIYGYDKIPSTPLRGESSQGGLNSLMSFKKRIADMLIGFGFMEIMNYSFVGMKFLNKLNLYTDDIRLNPITIINPLGEDTAVMRTSLVPNMLQTLSLNLNKGNDNVRFFESSVVFFNSPKTVEGLPSELNKLCLGAYGVNEDFFSLRSICEAIFFQFGIDYKIVRAGDSYYHIGRVAEFHNNNSIIGTIGEINPEVYENFDINKKVYIAELDIDAIMKLISKNTVIKETPKFPPINRDLAIVFEESTEIGPVMDELKNICGKNLESISLFDVYRGIPIKPEHKSVAFSLIFRSPDRTLTDDEIQGSINKSITHLEAKYNAHLR